MTKQIFSYSEEEDQEILDTELQWVRTNFFPNWDLLGEWTIKSFWHHTDYLGGVRYSDRKILIHNHLLTRSDGKLHHQEMLQGTIIHEVAHAVLPKGFNHGRRWLEILLDCSVRAEKLNMTDLANRLLEDAFNFCCNNGRIVSNKVFDVKIQFMLRENPEPTFSDILDDIDNCIECCNFFEGPPEEKIGEMCLEAYYDAKGKKLTHKRYFFIKPGEKYYVATRKKSRNTMFLNIKLH